MSKCYLSMATKLPRGGALSARFTARQPLVWHQFTAIDRKTPPPGLLLLPFLVDR